ncbi:MAG: hypothetical protein JW913_13600 [Chitinispirillaceae bacterium]|nr:hypothetical protein [Chitinispirillaceae bacterium]
MKQNFASLITLAAAFMMCNKSPTSPDDSGTSPLTLITTDSSSVAAIVRIPDKAVYVKGDSVLLIATPFSVGRGFR